MIIGVLTGGGDAPGLNAAIRGVVRTAEKFGYTVKGIEDGWKGLLELIHSDGKSMVRILSRKDVAGILDKGGTILGSSRTNPLKEEGGIEKVIANIKKLKLDAIIAIGGEDTISVAIELKKRGINIVAIPKTIDNDVGGTGFCIGFKTAVQIATEALDRLHSTAEAHHRIMILEVMGRHYGWIATYAGIAGGADFILIPEKQASVDEIVDSICKRYKEGKNFSLIVVAEGATIEGKEIAEEELDAFGHKKLGGIGEVLAKVLKDKTNFETRPVNLGHLLRGGTPVAEDRYWASRLGIKAVKLIKQGRFGRMVALPPEKIIAVPLEKALSQKGIDNETYEDAKVFFS